MRDRLKSAYINTAELVNTEHKWITPLVFCFLLALAFNVRNDYDIYFLVENGRYIIENMSFPTVDWISMHDDLNIILQQWIVSVVDYLIYENFSYIGLIILVALINMLTYWIVYKTIVLKTGGSYLTSYAITFAYALLSSMFTPNPRPMFWSVLFIGLCVFVMEIVKKYKNIWLLFTIPIISIAQANSHSTFWLALFGVYLIYLFEIFKLGSNFFNVKRNYFLVILVTNLIVVTISCLINPYGITAIMHALYTRGYEEYGVVSEMQPSQGLENLLFILIPLVVYIYLLSKRKMNTAIAISMVLYIITLMASVFAARCVIFMNIMWAFAMGDIVKLNSKTKKHLNTKDKLIIVVVTIAAVMMSASTLSYSIDNWGSYTSEKDEIVEFLSEDNSRGKNFYSEDITLGQYLYNKLDMHPYIDGRLETYIKSLNGKADIFSEYYDVLKSKDFDQFIEKYKFDYLILRDNSSNANFAPLLDNYNEIFDSFDEGDFGKTTYKVYKRVS